MDARPIAKLCVVSAATIISSCSDISYNDPEDGPDTARIRFASDAVAAAPLQAFEDPSCNKGGEEWLRLQAHPGLRTETKRLGIPLWNYTESAAKEIRVPTRDEFYYVWHATAAADRPACFVSFSFKPLPKRDYEVFLSHDWKRAICSATVYEITGEPKAERRLLKTFPSSVVSSNTSSTCITAAKAAAKFW